MEDEWDGWIFNEPTQEWHYWVEGEIVARVAIEAWTDYKRWTLNGNAGR